jgi:chitodextrinase
MNTKNLITPIIVAVLCTSLSISATQPQLDPDNPGSYILSKADLVLTEKAKTSNPMYETWSRALRTQSNTIVNTIIPNSASNPENVKRAERVFGEYEWNYLTAMAAPEYTYTRFLKAIGKFPAFCGDYVDSRDADAICQKSIITAFAHFSQETGGHILPDNISDNPAQLEEWQQALVHVREMGWSEGEKGYITGCGQDDWQNRRWPCAPNQGYFGRGAKQLSYHFNYGAFSEVMFEGDATVLLNDPAQVADSWLNLASAIWFFLTPQAPKPAMLHVIDRTWQPSATELAAGIGYGFGTTINIINGGIECGTQNKDKGQPVNRISYWVGLSDHYQIIRQSDEENTCWQQTPFGSLNLSNAEDVLYTNWEGDWQYYADRPGGFSFECKLVGYQTAYSALVTGDYQKCVTNFYDSHQNWPEVRMLDELPDTDTPATKDPVTDTKIWDVNKVYLVPNQVTYEDNLYQASWWTQGDKPSDGGAWKLITNSNPIPPGELEPQVPPIEPPTTPTEPELTILPTEPPTPPTEPELPIGMATWEINTVYYGGDQVNYNNVLYTAKWWTQGNQPDSSIEWQK